MNTTELIDLIEAATGKRKLTLTPEEFATITGRSYKDVWAMVRAGKLKHSQACVGGRIRIDFREINRVLEGELAA